jgi:hypothetical protein
VARALISGPRGAVTRLATVGRRRAFRDRRLVAGAALLAAAVVLGGLGGVLLGIFGVIVMLDAVIPMPGMTRSEADDRFRRLVGQRRHARRMRRLRGLEPERLVLLDDRAGWAATANRRDLGVETIAIDSITGTVEELKARSFDRRFRPDRSSAEHWKRLWLAQAHGATMPPISVYRVGAEHLVRDGHHRLSVAREQGFTTIDAEVVELHRPPRG